MFALIGQALASSAMSCDISMHTKHSANTSSHHEMMSMASMTNHDHANMKSPMAANVQPHSQDNKECCVNDCYCPKTGCGHVVFLTATPIKHPKVNNIERAFYIDPAQRLTSISELFRPPIFA